jgi:predicted DNA-binding transcriptional regulator AlpA
MKKARKPKANKFFRALKQRDVPAINPDFFYRLSVCPPFLGYELSQLKVKIDCGELPRPVSLSDSGRALGYYGSQLLEIKAKRIAEAQAA